MSQKLSFITDKQLYNHVKNTVEKYRAVIHLKDFQKNIIDPIKLTFDAKIYQQTWEEIIEGEVIRQLDKSNNNHIGYFHQNILTILMVGRYQKQVLMWSILKIKYMSR